MLLFHVKLGQRVGFEHASIPHITLAARLHDIAHLHPVNPPSASIRLQTDVRVLCSAHAIATAKDAIATAFEKTAFNIAGMQGSTPSHMSTHTLTWKRLIALSLGTVRAQLAQRMKAVWPRPFLFLPPLRLFLVILHRATCQQQAISSHHDAPPLRTCSLLHNSTKTPGNVQHTTACSYSTLICATGKREACVQPPQLLHHSSSPHEVPMPKPPSDCTDV